MSNHQNSLRQTFELAGIGWLRVAADGALLDANNQSAAAFGAADTVSLIRQMQAGDLSLPDDLAALLRKDGVRAGDIVASRLACVLRPGTAVQVTVIACGVDVFDVLLLPALPAPLPHRAEDAVEDVLPSQQVQQGVCVTDGSHIAFVNAAFAEMLGHAPEELAGVAWRDLVSGEDRERVRRLEGHILRGERVTASFQARLRMKHSAAVREVAGQVSRVFHDGRSALLYTVYDITRARRSEFALRDYARRMRKLTQQVIDVQENERRNLARELHDEIGQQLTIVRLSLEAVRADIADNASLEDALASVADLTRQVRELSLDLRPSMLDDLGLPAALRWYAGRAARLAGFHVVLDIEPEFPRLLTAVETLYFRVAQEAITNVLRHAGARTLAIDLHLDASAVRLAVVDDGRGFDFPAAREASLRGRSGGLLGMQERAALCGADLHIESVPGKGTRLSLNIPFSCAGIRAFRA